MKFLLAAAAVLTVPALVLAQTAPAPAKPAATKAAATAEKPAAAKPTPPRRPVRRSALKAVEEITPIDQDADVKLSDAEFEIAKRVYLGVIPCELGASVTITANEKRPGFFLVETKGAKFRMRPVEARTGAIRLEDARAGALWIQLGNKSMLMSQKLGQRLADECMSPVQMTMADELRRNPVPGLLDAPKPAASAALGTTPAPSGAAAAPASAAK